MEEIKLGIIVHFFGNINVAVIKLKEPVKQGDRIHIRGTTADFEQILDSMQIERTDVTEAKAGDSIGIQLENKAREGDWIYKIT